MRKIACWKVRKIACWKVCLHRPLTRKCHLIHVCRLVRCLNSPLRSKKRGLSKSIRGKVLQTTEPRHKGRAASIIRHASNREELIENDSSEAWDCFMCDDIVKKDMIKCQVCLRWAHSACADVGKGLDVFRKVVINKKLFFCCA